MKASELNGTHLGQVVAVIVGPGPVAISGTLAGVNHEAPRISERAICQAEETYILGVADVTVTFIDGTTATTRQDAKVAVSDQPAEESQ